MPPDLVGRVIAMISSQSQELYINNKFRALDVSAGCSLGLWVRLLSAVLSSPASQFAFVRDMGDFFPEIVRASLIMRSLRLHNSQWLSDCSGRLHQKVCACIEPHFDLGSSTKAPNLVDRSAFDSIKYGPHLVVPEIVEFLLLAPVYLDFLIVFLRHPTQGDQPGPNPHVTSSSHTVGPRVRDAIHWLTTDTRWSNAAVEFFVKDRLLQRDVLLEEVYSCL
jgi:hypothetical protein